MILEGTGPSSNLSVNPEKGAPAWHRRRSQVLLIFLGGLLLRLFHAEFRFLNADEALHYLLSIQPSLKLAYRATLTTAHPPLLILLLHYWGVLGRSEVWLRFPSIITGMCFCWVIYRWLKIVASDRAAMFGLSLLLFSPALVYLSAEVRQYGLLLLFSSLSLYFLESGLQLNSSARIACSSLFLVVALSSHYSALLVALALGAYTLARFTTLKLSLGTLAIWVAGQLVAIAFVSLLYFTHIAKLRARGAPAMIAGSYLRRSVYHAQEEHWFGFVARANLRLFHYFFSQGAVGVLALILFVVAIALLLTRDEHRDSRLRRPAGWQLAVLFLLPALVNCCLALVDVYPYGGTRHNSYLAMFVLPPIAILLAGCEWKKRHMQLGVLVVLGICNLFPSPLGEYIRVRDQNRAHMAEAVNRLRQLTPSPVIFTDDQGGLLLSYYLCHNKVVQLEPPLHPFIDAGCGSLSVVSIDPRDWIFKANTFSDQLSQAQRTYGWKAGTNVWFFQAGWFVDKEYALRRELADNGCIPHEYGNNILACQLRLSGEADAHQ